MNETIKTYDYIIIGSGFGGSVSALRLAEKGHKVLVIEKGRDFSDPKRFPKTNWNLRKWLWLPKLKFFGIQKVSFFKHVSVLSGVGVGGGSLVYANTLPRPKKEFFNHGPWKSLEDWERKLSPYYDKALKMLGAEANRTFFDADNTLKEFAKKIGKENSFRPTDVAVHFGRPGITVSDPYFNGKGPDRTGCIACGACMTGCRHNAKNTLDKNYLYLARKLGVEIMSETEVVDVTPLDGDKGESGYRIKTKPSTKYFGKKRSFNSKGIIFSGGVLGTLDLLLKLHKSSLPNLSKKLGEMVRTNNESLILNTTTEKNFDFSKGVAIGSMIEVDKDSHLETVRYGKGSGFWRTMMVPMISEENFFLRSFKLTMEPFRAPIQWAKVLFVGDYAKSTSIHLFMQHLDSALTFKRGAFGLKTKLSKGAAPSAFIKEAHKLAREYCKIIKGKPMVMFTEAITGVPSTAHILGGACMGENDQEGVINKDNKVFNYENMYIFDGSMISANPGVNPSLTICAITEYGMSKIPANENL